MADDGLSKKLPPWASQTPWPIAVPEGNRLRVKPEFAFENHQPTSRDRMVGVMADYLYGGGKEGYQRANSAMNYLDWTPVGILNDAYDVGRAIGAGHYGDAALMTSLAVLPGPSEKLVKRLKGKFRELPGRPLFGFKPRLKSDTAQGSLTVSHNAKDYGIYNPPDKPQRPFNADYPNGAKSDAAGNLLEDMEGRPLTGKQIIGRQTVGGPDIGASPVMDQAIAKDISGNDIQFVPRQNLDDDHGRSHFDFIPGKPLKPKYIEIADDLPPSPREMTIGHEAAHFVDEMAGQIPTDGLDDELRFVYNTTGTGRESAHPPVSPESMGYAGADVQREMMTEAVRTYRVNPNWFKTVAPRTAARIREWVNTHPELSKFTQFNSLAAGAVGLALAEQSDESEARQMSSERRYQQSNVIEGLYPILGPPVPFELVERAGEAASRGRKQIVDALIRRGITPQARNTGKLKPLVRALLDLEVRQKARAFGGPR